MGLWSFLLQAQSLTDYVNPFIGTKGMGHTFPGACVPHGAIQLSPDTDTIPHNVNGVYQKEVYRYCAGYQYDDKSIVGFSHTHMNGTGHSDLGDILLMPTVGSIRLNPGVKEDTRTGYRSAYEHTDETARPGYYSVVLKDYSIKAELTATERVGVHRYTYPEGEGNLIIDLNHAIYNYAGKVLWSSLRVENDTLLTGYRITNGWARVNPVYFAVSLSKPIVRYGGKELSPSAVYKGFWRKFDQEHNFPEMAGRDLRASFVFDCTDGKPLEVKVALSGVSTAGAMENLKAEAAGKSFDFLHAEAERKWEEALSAIRVKGDSDKMANFYTSLYHTLINPSVYTDTDGNYRGVDQNTHQAGDFTNYTVFSLWDTFRALHPLFNIIDPEKSRDMLASLLQHSQQSVHKILPVWSHMGNENWCMIGYHAVSLLADGITKNIPVDKGLALEAMLSSSNLPYYDGIASYKKLGYVPLEENASAASITLEYAYDDWTIYHTAEKTGEKAIAETYKKRAANYKHVFNPANGYACARHADGRWMENPDIYDTSGQGFIEGNALNYSYFVPHDVKGLIACMGGDRAFIRGLDNLFTDTLPASAFEHTEDVTEEGILGSYVHGNEPSHHVPYLYMWTSQPWKTAERIREIFDKMYQNRIDGLCGNDDCGQMSAWYVFSAMGFYPVCPGSDQYVFGAPALDEAEIRLEDGKTFRITAENLSGQNKYVKTVFLNGKPYTKAYLTHQDIMNGGTLRFVMAGKPGKRAYRESEKPYSLSNDIN
ncbi:MAG: GH92 family glycosyl hydrolase [Parabacteroides sp.]|nr:GH92 family glycosyl hydrolase [Parabacteroides sp.]